MGRRQPDRRAGPDRHLAKRCLADGGGRRRGRAPRRHHGARRARHVHTGDADHQRVPHRRREVVE